MVENHLESNKIEITHKVLTPHKRIAGVDTRVPSLTLQLASRTSQFRDVWWSVVSGVIVRVQNLCPANRVEEINLFL